MSTSGRNSWDQDSNWWFGTDDLDLARNGNTCECGFDATYKSRKDARDYLKQLHMHSFWCPKYRPKPQEEPNGE